MNLHLQLGVVQFCFDELTKACQAATAVGFVSCCGKNFFQTLCEYANRCCFNESEHKYLLNTATGSFQPGAFYIKWPWVVASVQSGDVEATRERYADAVAYNKNTHLNEIVSEIKQDDSSEDEEDSTSAEAQHNQQMIGLWRPEQQVMLGLEFYTDYLVPKVLLLHKNELLMFYLKRLDLRNISDVGMFTKLVITFTAYVQCCKAPQVSHSQ